MKETKLDKEELEKIQRVRELNQQLIVEFGQIEISQRNLNKRKNNAEDALEKVREEEQSLLNELKEKYNDGSIDLDRGVFTPAPAKNDDTPTTAFDE